MPKRLPDIVLGYLGVDLVSIIFLCLADLGMCFLNDLFL